MYKGIIEYLKDNAIPHKIFECGYIEYEGFYKWHLIDFLKLSVKDAINQIENNQQQ